MKINKYDPLSKGKTFYVSCYSWKASNTKPARHLPPTAVKINQYGSLLKIEKDGSASKSVGCVRSMSVFTTAEESLTHYNNCIGQIQKEFRSENVRIIKILARVNADRNKAIRKCRGEGVET